MSINNTIKPIFICGCGHSGTTLIFRILHTHQQFYTLPNEYMKYDKTLNIKKINKHIEKAKQLNKKAWILKEPTNIDNIPTILKHHPNAKIIIMLRDGRDVSLSFHRRKSFKNFNECVKRWYDKAKLTQIYYQNNPYPNNVTIIKLEDLTDEFTKTMKNIFQFIDEPYVNLSDYHQQKVKWFSNSISKPKSEKGRQNHLQLRNYQINQPIYNSSRWKEDLTPNKNEIFFKITGNMLKQLGY